MRETNGKNGRFGLKIFSHATLDPSPPQCLSPVTHRSPRPDPPRCSWFAGVVINEAVKDGASGGSVAVMTSAAARPSQVKASGSWLGELVAGGLAGWVLEEIMVV